MKKAIVGLVAALAMSALAIAPEARADGPAPLFEFFASSSMEGQAHAPYPPPGSGFEGACGLTVDSKGNFYVADYQHHAIDVFTANRQFVTQLTKIDPADGPCGMAVDSEGNLYVNDFHRNVTRYTPAEYPLGQNTPYGAGVVIDDDHPTGVAVNPVNDRIYVDDRTYIAVYDSSGAPIEVEKTPTEMVPLRIGEGTLEEGSGIAISQFSTTSGYVYVADAASGTVEVYNPASDTETPIQQINGSETPPGRLISLHDAALTVDRLTGRVYVGDLLQLEGYERPEVTIYGFQPNGTYIGHLSYNVIDARPIGLTIDNSPSASIGRVYVTSGNTSGSRVYAYAPNSLSTEPSSCAPEGPCVGPSILGETTSLTVPPGPASGAIAGQPVGSGTPEPSGIKPTSPLNMTSPSPGEEPRRDAHAGRRRSGAMASGAIVQKGTLRVSTNGKLSPSRLPRGEDAPIAISVSGQISTTDGSEPPQLKTLRIEVNRHGRLDFAGLPTCSYAKIQTASSARAMRTCKDALVGKGSFAANIVLSGQEPYPTEGKLLVFNGKRNHKPVLFGQIYAARPFATSFVIVFGISKVAHGTYGTALTASLPRALGNWGYVTSIKMRLARRFTYGGKRRSYLSAACPAPAGFGRISFPLARTSFSFSGVGRLNSTLVRECRARE